MMMSKLSKIWDYTELRKIRDMLGDKTGVKIGVDKFKIWIEKNQLR